MLNVVDEFTRIALGSRVARSIGTRDVVVHLDHLFGLYGQPAMIRSDNGREFIAQTVHDWLRDRGVEPVVIAKASPQQNAARAALEDMTEQWGKKYAAIIRLWESA